MAAAADSTEAQLAWESAWRGRAAVAAALAGALMLGGTAALQFGVFSGYPTVGPIQALEPILRGLASPPVDPRSAELLFRDQHAAASIATSLAVGVGTALLALVLTYLLRATAHRRPEVPAAARPLALIAPLAAGLLVVAGQVVSALAAHDFAGSADQGQRTAESLYFKSDGLVTVGYLGLASQLAVGFAFVLVALNAMRVGLLTRFMGVLGIIVGVLAVIPQLASPVPVVQAFWLFALAVMISGRWPNGTPPAWVSGQAEPWPSQQELREAREAARAQSQPPKASGRPVTADPDTPAPAPTHPASKKRKRKRRR